MTIGRRSSVEGSLRTLSLLGAVGVAEDRALLARFAMGREGGDEAFRILVERHGPMVFRVCRQVVGDVQLAEDATQAVFLVLARKASRIRVDGSLAPWLHVVARRVAAKARAQTVGRRQAEARSAGVAAALREGQGAEPPGADDWSIVHDEVGRLPEKYRTPVVLCYLQEQTYEQAARLIGCPVGTVRVRLNRARERLRSRLARHGFGPAQVVAFGLGRVEPGAELVSAAPGFVEACVYGIARVDATLGAVRSLRMSRDALAGSIATSVLNLYQGGIQTMMISRWMTIGACLTAAGITGAGTLVFATAGPITSPADEPKAEISSTPALIGSSSLQGEITGRSMEPVSDRQLEFTGAIQTIHLSAKVKDKVELEPNNELEIARRRSAQRRLELAKQRYDAQLALYEEQRLTVDRVIAASRQLMLAEAAMNPPPQPRLAAAKGHLERMTRLQKRVQLQTDAGRGSIADNTEVAFAQGEAADEYLEAQQSARPSELDALRRRVEKLEQELETLKNPAPGANAEPVPTDLKPPGPEDTHRFDSRFAPVQ